VLAPGLATTPLRISDDRQMAVEDTNLTNRQPKVFYATDKIVKKGNSGIKKGQYRMVIEQRDAITVAKPNGSTVSLHRIVPSRAASPNVGPAATGTSVTVEGVCDAVARTIIGYDPQLVLPKLESSIGLAKKGNDNEYKVARYFIDRVTNTLSSSKAKKNANTALTGAPDMLAIAQAYMNVLLTAPAVANQIAKDLGVNEFALPEVGQSYGSVSLGQTDTSGIPDFAQAGAKRRPLTDVPTATTKSKKTRDVWGTHYGAVVAASGTDRITLENYGRTHEEGSVIANDPIYYFQMYGTAAGQSWHEVWSTGTNPTVNPITMVY
jgi:hypothetical protein